MMSTSNRRHPNDAKESLVLMLLWLLLGLPKKLESVDFKEASSKYKRAKKTLTIEKWISITETGNVSTLA